MIYRRLLLVLLVMFVAVSCNEDAEITPKEKGPAQKIQVTSLSQQPQLDRVLDAAGFMTSGSANGRTNSAGFEIDIENIIKMLQADSVYSSYTFNIVQSDAAKSFSNLIIEEFEQGYLGFILTYEWETEFTGLANFTGKVTRTTLDGELLGETFFENGREEIQILP